MWNWDFTCSSFQHAAIVEYIAAVRYPTPRTEQNCYSWVRKLGCPEFSRAKEQRRNKCKQYRRESSIERPKIKNFLLNPDNKGLMTYISLFNPSLSFRRKIMSANIVFKIISFRNSWVENDAKGYLFYPSIRKSGPEFLDRITEESSS